MGCNAREGIGEARLKAGNCRLKLPLQIAPPVNVSRRICRGTVANGLSTLSNQIIRLDLFQRLHVAKAYRSTVLQARVKTTPTPPKISRRRSQEVL